MEHVRELLQSRIEEVDDPVQRVLLRDVLADVFGELLKYSEERFSGLEEKLDGELRDPSKRYYVYTGICKKDRLDESSRCLFRMGAGEERDSGCLGTMFLACDYPVICRCLQHTYQAKVETDKGEYRTAVSLRYCSAYLEVMERLYQQFLANQRPWHTINCPFLNKMLDIVDNEGVVPMDAAVQKVEIALGELSGFIMDDLVLVWNIQEEMYKASVEIEAAGRESVYEHRILLSDTDAGYLAVPESENGFTVIHLDGALSVRTKKEAHKKMKLAKIAKMEEGRDYTSLLFPLQSNQRNMRHADRQALYQPRFSWTRGGLERILSSYKVFGEFELVDFCEGFPAGACSIDMNPFIRTHSILKNKRKMSVILRPRDSTDIFRYEKMFFLVAELQLCSEEYEWAGILRD